MPTYEVIGNMVEQYINLNETEFLQMFNRELYYYYYYYGRKFKDKKNFIKSILLFSKGFGKFVKDMIKD